MYRVDVEDEEEEEGEEVEAGFPEPLSAVPIGSES
jgi:hypothetical protein